MDKKLVAAAGATVTSAAFQLSTVIWPDWIKVHKEVVLILWIVALGLWAWWAVAHFLSLKRSEAKTVAQPPPIQVPINVQVNPVFNNNPTISPVQTNQQITEVVEPPRSTKSKPNLVALAVSLGEDEYHDFGEGKFQPVWVVGIRNPLPSCDATSVCAGIDFTGGSRITHHIQKSFWLNELTNQIEIPMNEIKYLVLGRYEKGRFFCYSNLQSFIPEWGSSSVKTSTRDVISFEYGPLTAEITLFNPRGGDVYLYHRLLMEEDEDGGLNFGRLP